MDECTYSTCSNKGNHHQLIWEIFDFQKGRCELGYQLSSHSKLHICANSVASSALLHHLLHGPLLAEPSRHKSANQTHLPPPPHVRSPTSTYPESEG